MNLPTVLIVEDCATEVFLTEVFLDDSGVPHRRVVSSSGRDALSWLQVQNHPPALIVLDLNMPEMSGFEFLQTYAKHYPRLRQAPIVVATNSALQSDRRRCLEYECVWCVVEKPLVLKGPGFMARVVELLERRESAV